MPHDPLTLAPSMRITEHDQVLTIRDRPTALWVLGLWFVAGGTLAMLMVFVATNAHELLWWERAIALVIGAGVFGAGLFTIDNAPATLTILNRRSGDALMRIRGLRRREDMVFRCRDVIVVEMHMEKDSDGDPCWQLRLGMRHGRSLPLHSMHRHGRDWCEARQRVIRAYLGLG